MVLIHSSGCKSCSKNGFLLLLISALPQANPESCLCTGIHSTPGPVEPSRHWGLSHRGQGLLLIYIYISRYRYRYTHTVLCWADQAGNNVGEIVPSVSAAQMSLPCHQEWAPGVKAGGQTATHQLPDNLHRQDQDQLWLPVSPEAGKHSCQDRDTTHVCTDLACLSVPRSGADLPGGS